MPAGLPESSLVEKLPSVQMTRGLDELDLPPQIGLAGLDLLRARVAVVGRPALEHVGDVDLLAGEADGRQQLLKQLAGLAYEGLALLVLVVAGRFADEHEVGAGVAVAEHGPGARLVQHAARAALHLFAQGLEGGDDVVEAGSRQWQVAQLDPAQVEQLLVAPLPPMSDDDECTAKVESRRHTSAEPQEGHAGFVPLRTSSSNAAPHDSQQNS